MLRFLKSLFFALLLPIPCAAQWYGGSVQNQTIRGFLTVGGQTSLSTATISGTLTAQGSTTLSSTTLSGTLSVNGSAVVTPSSVTISVPLAISTNTDIGYIEEVNACYGGTSCLVSCPSGTILTGGGCEEGGTTEPLIDDGPNGAGSLNYVEWGCATSATTSDIYVYAICARLKSP